LRYILLGGRGLLGSGFREQLGRNGADFVMLQPPWHSVSELTPVIRSQLGRLLWERGPATVIWAAGVGHVGASPDELAAETAGITAATEALRDLPSDKADETTLLFASSAGALFAGIEGVIDETTRPRPIAAYGLEKLRQEALLARAAEDTGARVIACRMSNLYGLASGRLKPRGLIGTAVRCSRLRHPMTIFVSADTRRDYLLNSDAAALAFASMRMAPRGFSNVLVREGRTRTIAEVLALVGAVTRRRVPVVFLQRPESLLQPRALRFTPRPSDANDVRVTPLETGIARMVMAPLAG
jgi:UDP-glucose 4-epimerase